MSIAPRRGHRWLALSLAACALPLGVGTSQARNGWWPRIDRLDNPPAADRAIMERHLVAAEQLILRTSGYATPRGFEARMFWGSSPRSDAPPAQGAARALWYYFVDVAPYIPTRDATAGGYSVSAWIRFNPEFGRVAEGAVESENGDIYFLERPRSERRYGATAVYGGFGESHGSLMVLFTANDKDPMLPVTREQFLRAQIHEMSREFRGLKADQQSATRTPYQLWVEAAPKRKAEREAALAQLKGILSAAEIEKSRQDQEATEREVTESLRKSEAQNAANLQTFRNADPLASLREKLAALSPQERASPAWAAGTELMPAGAPGAKRVVRIDPAFLYASTESAARPRAILVYLSAPQRGLEHAQTQLYREMDWAAVRAMLPR